MALALILVARHVQRAQSAAISAVLLALAAMSWVVTDRSLGKHPLLPVGVALVAVGLAFKIAAVPFHTWAPDAYQGAMAPVAAFLAAGSKAAGLAALVRVCLVAFAPEQRI